MAVMSEFWTPAYAKVTVGLSSYTIQVTKVSGFSEVDWTLYTQNDSNSVEFGLLLVHMG